MLGRWLDRLHENEERITPISFIVRNIGKQIKTTSKRSKHNYSMLGRWLDRLHENEERITPISFIVRNIGKQVVYICIKKMSIDLKMAAKT